MNNDFDRLVARAADPNLIPGIYNYCDRRCPRCPFTERCLSFLENRGLETQDGSVSCDAALAEALERSIQRTIEFLKEVAERDGFDLSAAVSAGGETAGGPPRHQRDPLVVRAREYAEMTYPVMRALEPVLALRGDAGLIDAADAISWLSTMIAPKVFRAIAGAADQRDDATDVQSDANGSVKIARLAIAESRRAWGALMEAGKATADGVPARAVAMLEELDAALSVRFPRAMDFVRPGFDEPAIAAGAPATRPAFEPRDPAARG